MIVGQDRKILLANRIAEEMGAEVGRFCWESFGHGEFISEADKKSAASGSPSSETKCWFCLADECSAGQTGMMAEVEAHGKTWETHWVPVQEGTYLHYCIDVSERLQQESLKEQLLEGLRKTNVKFQVEQVDQLEQMFEAAPAASGVEASKAF